MKESLFVRVLGCTIQAVPSCHFRFPFAQAVNTAFADPATMPDAIAVELPGPIATEVRQWFRELGIKPGCRRKLPVMLALVEQPLASSADSDSVVSPPPLSTMELLPLSPTDSIVESIRCSLEADVALYGIDAHLDSEYFSNLPDPGLCPDPLDALKGLAEYTAVAAGLASRERAEVHQYREQVMTCRLLELAEKHRRLLFVCGAAHWPAICRLLAKASTETALPQSPMLRSPATRLVRTIVHPAIALSFMDVSPAMVRKLERLRVPAGHVAQRVRLTIDDVKRVQTRLIRAIYSSHFRRGANGSYDVRDFASSSAFEHMLLNDALLQQRVVPSAHGILAAAQLTMSRRFRREACDAILKYPFVTPKHPRFTALPALMPAGRPGVRGMALFGKQGRGPLYSLPVGSPAVVEEASLAKWKPAPGPSDDKEPGVVLNWPPIDRLVSALSVQAIDIARRHVAQPRSEPFSGALEDGLDIRATVRSYSRGEDTAYVRTTPYRARRNRSREARWEPVVWIHHLATGGHGQLRALAEPLSELIPFASNPQQMAHVRERATVVVEQIAFGTVSYASRTPDVRGGIGCYCWQGLTLFSPCHFTWQQTAAFLEQSEYKATPLVSYPGPTSERGQVLRPDHALVRMFAEQYGMTLDLDDWRETLIRMAVPFAKTAVTVVAPDGYEVRSRVRQEAARHGIEVRVVPRSSFERAAVEQIVCWYGARPLADTACTKFSEATEREFGERADANSNLLPAWLRDYGQLR